MVLSHAELIFVVTKLNGEGFFNHHVQIPWKLSDICLEMIHLPRSGGNSFPKQGLVTVTTAGKTATNVRTQLNLRENLGLEFGCLSEGGSILSKASAWWEVILPVEIYFYS